MTVVLEKLEGRCAGNGPFCNVAAVADGARPSMHLSGSSKSLP